MIQISVIVCTHNRANMLANALGSLAQQTLAKDLFEIIVVDNGSVDATLEVVREFRDIGQVPNVVLVREDRLGLGYARNTGFRHAGGIYVAFVDDDARADKDWLKRALESFEHVNPTPIVVGGPIFPFYDNSLKPAWFKDEIEIRTWGDKPRFLNKRESFSGSNMIFRREAIEKYGGFDVRAGMRGEYVSVGEETSLFEKIWQHKEDAHLYYSPRVLVFHAVPDYKMTVSYQLKRAFAAGQAWHLRQESQSLRRRLQLLLSIVLSVAKLSGLFLAHLGKYPTYQNWIVESFAPIAADIGRLLGCLGITVPVRQR